jgi:hypothetical protein
MWTSSVLVGPNQWGSHTSSMMRSRRRTSPGFAMSRCTRSNSRAASSIAVLGRGPRYGVEPEGTVLDRAVPFGRAAASHDRLDAGRELPGGERLDHVVIRAELQAEDAVDLLAHRDQHHDGDVGGAPDLASEVTPVTVREHDVEQDEIGRLAPKGLPRAGQVGATSASNPSRPRLSASGSEIAASSSTRRMRVAIEPRWYPSPYGRRHPEVTPRLNVRPDFVAVARRRERPQRLRGIEREVSCRQRPPQIRIKSVDQRIGNPSACASWRSQSRVSCSRFSYGKSGLIGRHSPLT